MFEYRVDFGPGYRVYFGTDGEAAARRRDEEASGPGHRGRHFNGGLRTPALDLRNEIAREAAANGLTETRIDELLTGDAA